MDHKETQSVCSPSLSSRSNSANLSLTSAGRLLTSTMGIMVVALDMPAEPADADADDDGAAAAAEEDIFVDVSVSV